MESNNRNKDKDNHLKLLCLSLWKIGVMPFSKHTKNLDYLKCIEGVLGYENAVNLIYNMAELAESKFKPIPKEI